MKSKDASVAVLFFGPSGAGKGTQVELLKEFLIENSHREVVEIDMGAKLREVINEGRYAGRKIQSIISEGNFLPGSVPIYFMYDYFMKHLRPETHLLADGVVRTALQAQAFHEAMNFFEHEDYQIIFLNLSDETIRQRLLSRGRSDDTKESIQRRIDEYKEKVLPLVNVFESFGKEVTLVDGEMSIEQVHRDILQKLSLI